MASLLTTTHPHMSSSKMVEIWQRSTAAEKDGYLSFLLNEWAKFPEKMAQQLPHLPFVDWNVQRKGVPTLWMEMFLMPRCVFDINTSRGQSAWGIWWQQRNSTVHTASQSFGALNSLHPQKDLKDRSASLQRSAIVIDMLPQVLQSTCNIEVVNTFGQALVEIFQQYNTFVAPEWNALCGIVAETLTPFVAHNQDVAPILKKWWVDQNNVMHPSHMRLPMSKTEIGLVGRPEYIFSYMIKEMMRGAFNKVPANHDPVVAVQQLDQLFWDACKQRWDQMGGKVQGDFFLPSLHLMLTHTRTEINKFCSSHNALEYTSRLEKLSLLAATSCWPWEAPSNDQEEIKPRRRM